jgi:repressor LexA
MEEHLRNKIYTFLEEYINANGKPPTIREVGQAFHITSTGHIDFLLKRLEARGLIRRVRGQSRGIQLTQPRGILIKGAIAAGTPLDIFEPDDTTASEILPLTGEFQTPNVFALVVRGQSMIGDYIDDGDYVVIDPQKECKSGDIVVATHLYDGVNGSATLKRIFFEQDQVRLQPANLAMAPISLSTQEWEREWTVQGKVIAIFRQYRPAT